MFEAFFLTVSYLISYACLTRTLIIRCPHCHCIRITFDSIHTGYCCLGAQPIACKICFFREFL